jgi:hypothetical protein
MSSTDDRAKNFAYWKWLRAANPLLPPFHMVKEAEMTDLGELAVTLHIVRPSEPFRFDPWDEAVALHGTADTDWTGHLAAAVSLLMHALQRLDAGDYDTCRHHAAHSAARIRQMAPEGTKWDEPALLVPGGERPRLRSVVQSLLEADKGHSACFRNEGSVTYHLVSAEASLHGLWLAAVEGR